MKNRLQGSYKFARILASNMTTTMTGNMTGNMIDPNCKIAGPNCTC
jgi:hypothetical protein